MVAPQINITRLARNALLERLLASSLRQPVVSLIWSKGGSATQFYHNGTEKFRALPKHWFVGFYAGRSIPDDWKSSIEGISFALPPGPKSRELDGKTIDLVDGYFKVV